MTEQLTQQITEYWRQWLATARSTEQINRAEATIAIQSLYELMDRRVRPVIVWCDSPWQCKFLACMLEGIVNESQIDMIMQGQSSGTSLDRGKPPRDSSALLGLTNPNQWLCLKTQFARIEGLGEEIAGLIPDANEKSRNSPVQLDQGITSPILIPLIRWLIDKELLSMPKGPWKGFSKKIRTKRRALSREVEHLTDHRFLSNLQGLNRHELRRRFESELITPSQLLLEQIEAADWHAALSTQELIDRQTKFPRFLIPRLAFALLIGRGKQELGKLLGEKQFLVDLSFRLLLMGTRNVMTMDFCSWSLTFLPVIPLDEHELHRQCSRGMQDQLFLIQIQKSVRVFMQLAKSVHSYLPLEGVCLVSDRPQFIHLDEQGRLHSADGAALGYRDGYQIFAWHGVTVPEKMIMHPDSITIDDIENEGNAEIRRVKLERFGLERYIVESGARKIHADETGELYRKDLKGDEPVVIVKVLNMTTEADGTRKQYFLRVPPNLTTARAAVAWTFGMTEEDYSPATET